MVTAVFNCSDYAETKEIWQWDYGQVLRIQGLSLPAAVEIHFALQEAGGESATRIGVTKDGVTDVTIPDSLLENDGTAQRYSIYAFIYLTDTNSGQTIKKITIPVKSRPKPQPFDTPEDAQLFREAIKAVNAAADRAGTSEKLAEGWAHGREDMPERAQDNAMYYAGKASEDARQTAADRETVKEMVDSVSDIEQQVEAVKGYAGKAQTAAKEAAKSQEASEGAAKAAGESATAAELSRQQAGQYATDAAERASDASDSADQASGYATKAGQAYESTAELAQQVQTDIAQTGEDQVKAINSAGATQVQAIKTEGAKQVQAVQDAAQEIAADREQIKINKEDIANLKSDKVDKDQGADNAGKVLGIGADGQVTPVEMGGGDVTLDQLLPLAIKTTSDKAEMLNITDSADFKMLGFNLYGQTEQVQTKGYNLWPMFKDAELSGVKMTVNKDGSVTLNGTCTRRDIFYLVLPLYPMTYTLSCDYTGTLPQNENPRCQIYAPDNTPLGINIRNDAKPDAKSTVTFNKYSEAYFRIRIENGHTYNNVTLRPMLYYGADTKPFEPYTGGFPSPRPQMRSKNLANPDDIVIGGLTEGAGLELVANNRIRTGYIPVTAGASYKYRTIYAVSNAHMYNTDKTRVGSYSSSVPIPEGIAYIRMSFGRIDGSDFTIDDLANFKDAFMFNEGETALPYEPYLIPEWPQPIISAGKLNEKTGKYEIQVKVTGKNLFDIKKAAVRDNWEPHKNLSGYFNYPVFVGKGNRVTISYPEKLPTGHGMYLTVCLIDTGNIVGWLAHSTEASLNNTKLSYTATTDYIYLNAHTNTIANLDRYFSDLQVEYGDIATAYQPYKEQIITLTTPNGLAGIPVSSGGNCTDKTGQQWVCDEIDLARGKYVQWHYKRVFNGTESFFAYPIRKGFYVRFAPELLTTRNAYCNMYPGINQSLDSKIESVIVGSNSKNAYFVWNSFYDDSLDDKGVENFKNYISEHPIELITYLDTPIEIDLSPEEIESYKALKTYYPTTIITNNANAQMQAQYVADPANYIDNHYISKEDTQAIMQRISNIETAMLKL